MDHPGRAALRSWLDSRPANFFEANQPLQRALRMHWGDERFAALRPRLSAFGETSATTIDEAARVNDRIGNHPRLDAYTGIGEQTEAIEFHPSYYIAGRAAYESGMLAVQAQPGNILFQGALFYLLCHNGEMGHACPIACTAGLILALQQRADPAIRARFLPPLLCDRYDELQHGAQFLTEVQGGSDVGANTLAAAPVAGKPDVWQLSGEKWFCSNINAQQFLVTARPEGAPEGTRGLGLFLVPRTREDGRVNGFRIRRLKNKIGTRTMASAGGPSTMAGWTITPVRSALIMAGDMIRSASAFSRSRNSSTSSSGDELVTGEYACRIQSSAPRTSAMRIA